MNYVNAALHDQFCLVYPKVWGKKNHQQQKNVMIMSALCKSL